jgi:hypothetical protein
VRERNTGTHGAIFPANLNYKVSYFRNRRNISRVVVPICNPSSWEAKAVGLKV